MKTTNWKTEERHPIKNEVADSFTFIKEILNKNIFFVESENC